MARGFIRPKKKYGQKTVSKKDELSIENSDPNI